MISEISPFALAPFLLLLVLAVALLFVIDRRLLRSVLPAPASAARRLVCRASQWRVAAAATGGTVVAVCVTTAALIPCLPLCQLIPVAALIALAVCETIGDAESAYMRCFLNTQAHRYYMLANGASVLETLIPSLRRALRAAIVPQTRRRALPLILKVLILFLGLLMGGASVAAAAITTLLMCAAAMTALVIATLTTAFLLKKLNICC